MLPYRFSLLPGTCCYLGSLLSPVWLLSTLSERALSTFLRFATLPVSFQPPLFPLTFTVRFWSVPLNWQLLFVLFFFSLFLFKQLYFLPWCLLQRQYFTGTGHLCIEYCINLQCTIRSILNVCVVFYIIEVNPYMRGCSCLVQKADTDNFMLQLKQNIELLLLLLWSLRKFILFQKHCDFCLFSKIISTFCLSSVLLVRILFLNGLL